MPIKFSFQKLPVDDTGKAYQSMDDFQRAMLDRVMAIEPKGAGPSDISCDILAHKDEVIEILSLSLNTRPARGRPRGSKNKPKTQDLPGIQPKAA